jgi:hypothetical protein
MFLNANPLHNIPTDFPLLSVIQPCRARIVFALPFPWHPFSFLFVQEPRQGVKIQLSPCLIFGFWVKSGFLGSQLSIRIERNL